ncbi:hypothetical protein BD289DRAFT_94947 [Coniella lustricola]|uniref:Uncharacterized protein n=1 Tax=Coniella lustricola TaxID=2025994 RepID=A0A2T2ZY97_9PEZI|nr:hypothetical protein BD289DRAFT_94947 [Coniella lustricola]
MSRPSCDGEQQVEQRYILETSSCLGKNPKSVQEWPGKRALARIYNPSICTRVFQCRLVYPTTPTKLTWWLRSQLAPAPALAFAIHTRTGTGLGKGDQTSRGLISFCLPAHTATSSYRWIRSLRRQLGRIAMPVPVNMPEDSQRLGRDSAKTGIQCETVSRIRVLDAITEQTPTKYHHIHGTRPFSCPGLGSSKASLCQQDYCTWCVDKPILLTWNLHGWPC